VKLGVGFEYHHDTNGIDFSRFSVQYLGLGLLLPLFWLISLRSIHNVLKMSKLAMACRIVYLGMIVTFFADNVREHRPEKEPINLLALNLEEIMSAVSTLSFSFVTHPAISPILK